MKSMKKGGYVKGKEVVPGNSPANDTVTIHVSPHEIILDKETIAKGPAAIVAFVKKELNNHAHNFCYGGGSYYDGSNSDEDPASAEARSHYVSAHNTSAENTSNAFHHPIDTLVNAVEGNEPPPAYGKVTTRPAQAGLDYYDGGTAPSTNNPTPTQDPDKAKDLAKGMEHGTPPLSNIIKGITEGWYHGGMIPKFNDGGSAPEKIDFQPLDSSSSKIDFQPIPGAQKQDSSLGEKLQTGLENYGNTVSLGYLPQLQAITETGSVSSPEYVKARDENIARIARESADNPKSALAGTAAGLALSGPLTPEIKGAGMIGGAAKGALYGAGYGALQNPGDTAGELNPMQAKERMMNAAEGTAGGGAIGAGAELFSKGVKALGNSADSAQEFANAQAVKASGGMLKDFRNLNASDKIDDLGKFALDNGIVKAGDSVHDVADKADNFRKQAGDKLDEVYEQAQKAADANPEAKKNPGLYSVATGAIDPATVSKFRGFNPVRDRAEILSSVASEMGDSADKKIAVRTVGRYLNQLAEDHGDQQLDPKTANNIKTQIDQKINYSRNPLSKDPAAEKGFSALRGYVANAVNNHIEDLGKATGNPDIAEKLAVANKEYGYSKQLQTMSEDRVNRDAANRMISPSDYAVGIGGAMLGATEGAAMGHPGEGAIAGLGAGIINHIGRKYGPSTMAAAANAAAPILEKTAVPVSEALQKLPNVTRAASQYFTRQPMNQNRAKLSDLMGAK